MHAADLHDTLNVATRSRRVWQMMQRAIGDGEIERLGRERKAICIGNDKGRPGMEPSTLRMFGGLRDQAPRDVTSDERGASFCERPGASSVRAANIDHPRFCVAAVRP